MSVRVRAQHCAPLRISEIQESNKSQFRRLNCNCPGLYPQDDCKVQFKLLMVSLSNHERLERASFDKLRMNGS